MTRPERGDPAARPASLLARVHDAVLERTPLSGATVEALDVGEDLLLLEVHHEGRRAAGVSHRPPGTLPGQPDGEAAVDVGGWAVDPPGEDLPLGRAVGLAALNALSAPLIDWRTGDPFEALDPDVAAIATVGLFGPAFRKFGAVDVRVIERRDVEPPETPPGVSVSLYGPEEAAAAVDGADVVFVTGSSLLYGGTEAYLAAARDVPSVVLVGSTASFIPEPAFEAGVTMLAGARVADLESVRAGILAGECATDLHDEGLEKVFVAADDAPGLDFG